jgi:hypothetical protein
MTDANQQRTRPRVTVVEVFLLVVFWLFSFRLLAVGVLLVAVALYVLYPLHRRRSWLLAACAAYFVALLLPVDLALASYPGRHYQSTHSGPRLVSCVSACSTGHTYCRQTYGEYVTHHLGSAYPPGWVFVWD